MTADGELVADNRLVFLHRHVVSARTRFLRFADGSVCAFRPLPDDAVAAPRAQGAVLPFSGGLLAEAARRLAVGPETLALEPDFAVDVLAGERRIHIHLVHFCQMDPPFAAAEVIGARFIDLAAARGMPATELALMRGAYELVI